MTKGHLFGGGDTPLWPESLAGGWGLQPGGDGAWPMPGWPDAWPSPPKYTTWG